MARRAGSADLPLHGGRVPAWLGQRMARLGAVIAEAIVIEYGRDEFLRRLAHPFWFQSFGAVMGMDWHSSGITTSVLGALKRGLAPRAGDLGLHVCGGRGRHSRATPAELAAVGARVGIDGDALARASRLVAKVDSAAVQDGFDLYLHGFIVGDDGRWVVIQQGMNGDRRQARRYHWLSEGMESFLDAPHAAIEGNSRGRIVNLADTRAAASRDRQLSLLRDEGPDGVVGLLRDIDPEAGGHRPAPPDPQAMLPHLAMPAHHDVRSENVVTRRLHGALAAAADGRLRFGIKGLGDYTKALPDRLFPGQTVTIEGPYGRFDFDSGRRQLWIAGGIGIAPFVAGLEWLADEDRPASVDLIYSTRMRDDALLHRLSELVDRTGVRLHLLVTPPDPQLTVPRLEEMVPDWRCADVWFCGPAAFGDAMRGGMIANGFPASRFHQEFFELR